MVQQSDSTQSHFVTVLGESMHYVQGGSGSPIVFLHGNPTSSFLWRNVIPHLTSKAKCIAPDLIGMGKSAKPAIEYSLEDHITYVDAFIEALQLRDITFVLHDWGVAIGLHYLSRFPERVRGVCFMEGHIHPIENWSDFDTGSESMFRALRDPIQGRRLLIDENMFIEKVLPSGMRRQLSAEEWTEYRHPYLDPADRLPLWRWPQEIPIEGQPRAVHDLIVANQTALMTSNLPKLLCHAHPGAVIQEEKVAWCRDNLSNLTTMPLGDGIHFLPEDHPHAIGEAISAWLDSFDQN